MQDLLRTAQTWMEGQRRDHLAAMVTYVRGSDRVSIPATLGKSEFDADDGNGAIVRIESQDWILTSADVLPTFNEPQPGDKIVDGSNEWTVCNVGQEPCWRYTDGYRLSLRAHVKLGRVI